MKEKIGKKGRKTSSGRLFCADRSGAKIKKRLFSAVLALALVCSLMPAMSLTVMAAPTQIDSTELYWEITDSILTISGNGIIPGYSAYTSPAPWYSSRNSITSIVIDSGVTGIGKQAFIGCSNATTVSIPDTVSSIGNAAFQECKKLESVVIPNGVNEIGASTFYCCYKLTNVTIPESVQKIGEEAFGFCQSITSITIPKSVTAIDETAFEFCDSLESVVMSSVNPPTAGDEIFKGSSNLAAIYVPSGSVEAYKSAPNWITYKDIIIANHNFTYSASGAVLTATCQNQDCVLTGGKVSLTLTASDENYSGSTTGWCEATDIDIELDGKTTWESTVGEAPTIHYTGTTAEGTAYSSDSKPTEDGSYTASIECDGQKAELNFNVGHIFDGQPYKVNAETGKHYQECKGCGSRSSEGNHDFSQQPYQVDEDGKHYQKCKDCGAESTHEAHSGGTATCKEKAKCSVCGEEYGDLAAHKYDTKWSSDETNHWHACTVCGDKKDSAAHTLETTTTNATLTANGKKETKCTVCGKVTKTETIYMAKTIKLSATKYTYDGKVKKPTVTVKDSQGKVIASSNYTVTYPSGRKNVGKYTVKVTFKGNYSGTKNLAFTINPPKTSISKLTAGRKAFTVKWAKKTTQVTGYEIQYSTSSSFAKGNKTVKVPSAKTVSKTISKLTGGKKYYVRIRTYKTVNKVKYYSDWSAKKSVTTKK